MTDTSSLNGSPVANEHPAAASYRARLQTLQAVEAQLQRKHVLFGYLRLAFGIVVVVLLLPPRLYVLLPIAAFALAARAHERILARLAATRRSIAFYEHALARIEDRWTGLRPRTTRLNPSASLYAADLDLFGSGSLFDLLCEARTSLGEDTLADWLLTPAPVAEILARHAAIGDLRPRLLLRESFAAAPGPAVAILSLADLAGWGESHTKGLPRRLQWAAPLLVLLTALAGWRSAMTHSLLVLVLMLVVNASVTYLLQRAYKPLFAELEGVSRALRTVQALMAYIENEPANAALLQGTQERLKTPGRSASAALKQLARLSTWADARNNYLIKILDVPLLYSLQLAFAVQRWKQTYGPELRCWLQTLGQFEALLSLAGYSYEHPEDPFPSFLPGGPSFLAHALGHPLLPSSACVRNNVSLGESTRLLLVSGSNMSGKSTLLRAVGVNAALAFAGAPVRALSLQLSPLTIAASIQVSDSLQAGRSRFYAEILQLRVITQAAAQTPPLLFLLDELLAGTNSSDRLVGAQALIRDLLRKGAIGLLSTHDLALTNMDSAQGTTIRNAHFEDQIVGGELHFDYTLREGVVERSNGLALMRLVGLDV